VESDWARLRAAATEVAARAYAPYSGLRVGAAGQTADGRVVLGCNVENASYGLTLCAECGLVSALHAAGGGTLAAVSVVAADGAPLLPCGRCRQLLLETARVRWRNCCPVHSPTRTWRPGEAVMHEREAVPHDSEALIHDARDV
jgi:cytidine deaminase